MPQKPRGIFRAVRAGRAAGDAVRKIVSALRIVVKAMDGAVQARYRTLRASAGTTERPDIFVKVRAATVGAMETFMNTRDRTVSMWDRTVRMTDRTVRTRDRTVRMRDRTVNMRDRLAYMRCKTAQGSEEIEKCARRTVQGARKTVRKCHRTVQACAKTDGSRDRSVGARDRRVRPGGSAVEANPRTWNARA